MDSADVLRPESICAQYARAYRDIYRDIEHARQLADINWPAWCYVPIGAAQAVLMSRGLSKIDAAEQGAIATGLAAWRAGGKHVLMIHAEMLRVLWNTPHEDKIKTDMLLRFPFWCAYIPIPKPVSGMANLRGIFVHLEFDVNHARPELRVLLDLDDSVGGQGGLTPGLIEIDQAVTIEDALRESYGNFKSQVRLPQAQLDSLFRVLLNILSRCMSIVMYICAENAQMRPTSATPARPVAQVAQPRRGYRRPQVFAPAQPAVWQVAWRIGAAIGAAKTAVARAAASASTGRTVKPHMRRAHWHTYLTGHGRSQRVVRWLAPFPVGLPDDVDSSAWSELMPTTARDVQ